MALKVDPVLHIASTCIGKAISKTILRLSRIINKHCSDISPGVRGSRPTLAGGAPDGDTRNQATMPFAGGCNPVRVAIPTTAGALTRERRQGRPVRREILPS